MKAASAMKKWRHQPLTHFVPTTTTATTNSTVLLTYTFSHRPIITVTILNSPLAKRTRKVSR
jgi:hypothetical protein